MATPPLKIQLDPSTSARVEAAAAAANMSVEDYIVQIIADALSTSGVAETAAAFENPHDWTEANRRLAEYDRTGVSIPLEEVLRDFRADLEKRLASKA